LRPLLLLLLALAVLAGIAGAAYLLKRASNTKGGAASHPHPVHLFAATSYDPFGDNKTEHEELIKLATDGNPRTFWTTEQYGNGLGKRGVGIVLDARHTIKLAWLKVVTDTPGFSALIRAGSSSSGTFVPVSGRQTLGRTTTFRLHGKPARYYLIWIKDLGGLQAAHVNEVRAHS
jgi:hypothetical protein